MKKTKKEGRPRGREGRGQTETKRNGDEGWEKERCRKNKIRVQRVRREREGIGDVSVCCTAPVTTWSS